MKLKSILLVFALALPVSIFVFLYMFGENKFEVPIYFREFVTAPNGCDRTYEVPYKVDQSLIPLNGTTILFFASGLSQKALRESTFQIKRVSNELHAPLNLTLVSMDSIGYGDLDKFVKLEAGAYEEESSCVFMAESNRLVLVDSLKQIRGFYKEGSMKEVDRLILELKILLNEY
ncbi:MAG: hypothetical protein AB7O48_17755 [Cyclobacteriaceae bacterium]